MHILNTSFNGLYNIGLYGFANDKFALIGKEIPDDIACEMSKVLKVPIHKITIAGTSLVGVFVAGNNNKLLVPNIIFDDEKLALKEAGVDFEVFDTKLTCLGNNIIVGDDVAIISTEFSDAEEKRLAVSLGVKTLRINLNGMTSVGSLVVLNLSKKRALISNDLSRDDQKIIESTFSVESTPGSINMGSPYVRSGIICNDNGFIVGSDSGGPEITNADNALGFLE